MTRHTITIEVGSTALFEGLQVIEGDSGLLGARLAALLMTGELGTSDKIALAGWYGIRISDGPGLRELDLSKGVGHEHPDIDTEKQYLALIGGEWLLGQFDRQWYGLRFDNWGMSGLQFDAPGTNSSRWERLFELYLPAGGPEKSKENAE